MLMNKEGESPMYIHTARNYCVIKCGDLRELYLNKMHDCTSANTKTKFFASKTCHKPYVFPHIAIQFQQVS